MNTKAYEGAMEGLGYLMGVYPEDELRGMAVLAATMQDNYPTISAQMSAQIVARMQGKPLDSDFYTLDVELGAVEQITTGSTGSAVLSAVPVTHFKGRNRVDHLCDLQDGETQSEEPVIVTGVGAEFVPLIPNAGYTALTYVADYTSSTTVATNLALRDALTVAQDGVLTGLFNGRTLLFEKRLRYLNSGGFLHFNGNITPASGGVISASAAHGLPAKAFRHELSEKFLLVNGKKFSTSLRLPLNTTSNVHIGLRVVLMGERVLRGSKL